LNLGIFVLTPWPFTPAELTAGLRRYFVDSTLTLYALAERPLAQPAVAGAHASHWRGLHVE
jgi:hypothetical protein